MKGFTGLLFVLFLSASVLGQTWRSLNGPSGFHSINESEVQGYPYSYDVHVLKDTLFAIPYEGNIFKRALNSDQWKSFGGSQQLIFEISGNGNYYIGSSVAVATKKKGKIAANQFLLSSDYGKTWNVIGSGIGPSFEDIFISQKGRVLVSSFRILELIEQESRFIQIDTVLSNINSFYEHEDSLFAATDSGLGLSLDDGETWEKAGLDSLIIDVMTRFNNRYLYGSGQTIFMQEQFGGALFPISDLPKARINTINSSESAVFAGTDSGLYSIDIESQLASVKFQELNGKRVFSMAFSETDLYVGTNDGLYKCTVVTEKCVPEHVPNSFIEYSTIDDNGQLHFLHFNGYSSYDPMLFEWQFFELPMSVSREFIFPKGDISLFIGEGSRIYTCDTHSSCTDTLEIDPGESLGNMVRANDSTLFIHSYENVLRSDDYGSTWERIFQKQNPRANRGHIRDIKVLRDSLLFIGTEDSLLMYNLTDRTVYPGNFEEAVRELMVTNDGAIYLANWESVQVSRDYGSTWTSIFKSDYKIHDYPFYPYLAYDEVRKVLYVVTVNGTLYVSSDGGRNWGVNDEFYGFRVEDFEIDLNGNLYVSTAGAGVYTNTRLINPPITISNEEYASTPDGFILHQNYPNPFNPSTVVSFELAIPQEVNLEVFNLFGQKIMSYELGVMSTGSHSKTLNFSSYASGMYFLRVRAGSKANVLKMMLIK